MDSASEPTEAGYNPNTTNVKEPLTTAMRHRSRCALCRSPAADDFDLQLLLGVPVKTVYKALLAEAPRTHEGTIAKHLEMIQLLASPAVWRRAQEARQAGGLSPEEIESIPIPQLQEKFERYLWGANLPLVLHEMRRRLANATLAQTVSYGELMESVALLVKMGQLLLGEPTARTATSAETADVSMEKLAELIADPEDRKAFIASQRELQRSLRTAMGLARKYNPSTVSGNGS